MIRLDIAGVRFSAHKKDFPPTQTEAWYTEGFGKRSP